MLLLFSRQHHIKLLSQKLTGALLVEFLRQAGAWVNIQYNVFLLEDLHAWPLFAKVAFGGRLLLDILRATGKD